MEHRDLYAVLGLAPTASVEEVRRSYHRLARENHPDANPGVPAKEAHFREIVAAYAVLGDAERRAAYDARRPTNPARPRSTPAGPAPRPAPRPGPPRRTMRGQIDITLAEAVLGGEKRIVLDLPGGGEQEVAVRVPRDTEDGELLHALVPGGELVLRVALLPHPPFRREGRDLLVDLPVPAARAILGGPVAVPTLVGPVEQTLPAGTSSGRRLTLPGQGGSDRAGRRGDLHAIVMLTVPAEINDEARALIERFAALTGEG